MLSIIFHLLFTIASAAVLSDRQTLSGNDVCQQISGNITGKVYLPLSLEPNFKRDIEHYMTSSTQTPMCVVEVASDADVSTVIKIVGSRRVPWGIKSGGHASNPGFSSTPGVFISLARLTQVTLSEDLSTVELGTGNLWTDVYSALDGTGVNVVGDVLLSWRGYSWLTDQYGLTCDTVVSFNLVLPNGTITKVDSSNPDLFFALKGGLNRFGIVTSIVLNTVPQQNTVYGGIQIYGIDAIPGLINATNTFQQENTDDKAQVILTINGAFDPFNNVGAIPLISNVESQSFASFAKATPSNLQAGHRGAFHTMMTTSLTVGFMQAVYNESSFYGALAILHGGTFLSYDVEPFTDYGRYATDSAFPHANSPLPLNLYFAWTLQSQDAFWRGVMQQSIDHLTEVAKREGIFSEDQYAYPNYALSTYGGAQLYGPTNAARLREIQSKYDPNGVMLLAGGFNI
ncbi:putative FAD dependent oxidoreductase [Botrytis cinerea]